MTQSELKARINLERRIARKTINALLEAGYALGVNDSEETTIRNSKDAKAVRKAMFTTDEDWLLVYREGKQIGWVRFIYGNDGWDVINDYTVNLETALKPVNDYTEKFS